MWRYSPSFCHNCLPLRKTSQTPEEVRGAARFFLAILHPILRFPRSVPTRYPMFAWPV